INGVETYAGEGIKIGIIDTGIDHTHVMFEDEGYNIPPGFPRGDIGFTNNKIIVARVFTKNGDSIEDSCSFMCRRKSEYVLTVGIDIGCCSKRIPGKLQGVHR
ncbi:hypothetical protein ACFL5F_09060, partial [Planctomycetota bacterium]